MSGSQQDGSETVLVHVYVLCWNEEVILPHFLRHYHFADKIVVCDNNSDDSSQELVRASSNGVLRPYETEGALSDDRYLEIKNSIWKESRGQADFVIVCDSDEFLYHPDLPAVLLEMKKKKATVLLPKGYEMVGEKVPGADDDLLDMMPEGMRLHTYDKCLLFDPNEVEEINYELGCHVCRPRGRVEYFRVPGLMFLHYKHLSPDYVWGRYEQYVKRMRKEDIAKGYAPHYQVPRSRLEERYEMMRKNKVDVIARAKELSCENGWQQPPADLLDTLVRGMDAFGRAEYNAAYELLEEVADWDPDRVRVNAALAAIFSIRGITHEFSYLFQRAVAIAEKDGSRMEALQTIAQFYFHSKLPGLALYTLERMLELAPARADLRLKAAYLARETGDLDKALQLCAAVVEQKPNQKEARSLYNQLLHESGRAE